MERNTELLNEVADHLEAHPEQYKQDRWAEDTECGTVGCVAGWALLLTYGVEVIDDGPYHMIAQDWDRNGGMYTGPRDEVYGDPIGDRWESITEHAGRLLGLDEHEADFLFSGEWEPHEDVATSLRGLARGMTVENVTSESFLDWWHQ